MDLMFEEKTTEVWLVKSDNLYRIVQNLETCRLSIHKRVFRGLSCQKVKSKVRTNCLKSAEAIVIINMEQAEESGRSSDEGSEMWDDDENEDEEIEDESDITYKCLLSDASFPTLEESIAYDKQQYNFDWMEFVSKVSFLKLLSRICLRMCSLRSPFVIALSTFILHIAS